jgi:hypothetical protein
MPLSILIDVDNSICLEMQMENVSEDAFIIDILYIKS